ncbi:hypothetical protein AGABI1DRAFT_134469 [Agaricus bisporus var. burnettii JB137-S8]|uniref:Uncharacterized protein n=1 Tax=Agaricus bisporus var. burnettii (strain JB137-S8 / ATCC MYA-4627 / FGSC 10392) TaxID=597362 RepID=K5WS99_AGABU|nr:uncharacterized protein AGABI1DRAFT_134469 [Agaricus bisporus var. burnettii JB137-S8]EKM73578.1 hypothetical protein AGABI1DRAFT_134469 [Agaricus bisporus var. burnettii JB137-S8]
MLTLHSEGHPSIPTLSNYVIKFSVTDPQKSTTKQKDPKSKQAPNHPARPARHISMPRTGRTGLADLSDGWTVHIPEPSLRGPSA